MIDGLSGSSGVLIELTEEECLLRLHRGGIGRVALSVRALPAIFPVNYTMLDGDIVFRTGPGTKLDAALRGTVVAFEVDDADPLSHTGWSVMVVGVARPISDPGELRRAQALPLRPWADHGRDTFVRLQTGCVSGRQLVQSGAAVGRTLVAEPAPATSLAG